MLTEGCFFKHNSQRKGLTDHFSGLLTTLLNCFYFVGYV